MHPHPSLIYYHFSSKSPVCGPHPPHNITSWSMWMAMGQMEKPNTAHYLIRHCHIRVTSTLTLTLWGNLWFVNKTKHFFSIFLWHIQWTTNFYWGAIILKWSTVKCGISELLFYSTRFFNLQERTQVVLLFFVGFFFLSRLGTTSYSKLGK